MRYSTGARSDRIVTMKLKKSSIEAVEETKPATGGAFIAARHRNPVAEVAARQAAGQEMFGSVCAILATVVLLIITALLYVNWDAIKSA